MKILGYNRSEKNIDGVEQIGLDQLLRVSDIVSINLPLTSDTRGLIGKKEIGKMKDGAILINTAREEIVDKKAVIDAIANNKLFGYGIETAIMKPLKSDDPYLQYPNIIVNPHNAFNTQEAWKKVKDTWVDNIVAFSNGKPVNLVN